MLSLIRSCGFDLSYEHESCWIFRYLLLDQVHRASIKWSSLCNISSLLFQGLTWGIKFVRYQISWIIIGRLVVVFLFFSMSWGRFSDCACCTSLCSTHILDWLSELPCWVEQTNVSGSHTVEFIYDSGLLIIIYDKICYLSWCYFRLQVKKEILDRLGLSMSPGIVKLSTLNRLHLCG